MSLIVPTRRGFISGIAALVAAPAIVRAQNIMPVRSIERYLSRHVIMADGYVEAVTLNWSGNHGVLTTEVTIHKGIVWSPNDQAPVAADIPYRDITELHHHTPPLISDPGGGMRMVYDVLQPAKHSFITFNSAAMLLQPGDRVQISNEIAGVPGR